MEEKPGRKRESIDEILSDLNGLLNKMPSILDGIKMPELQPAEPPKPVSRPESRPEPESSREESGPVSSGGGDKADKTVVLQAFSGLQEGSPAPEEIPATAPVQAPPEEAFQPQEPAAAGIPTPEPQRPERTEELSAAAAPEQSRTEAQAPAGGQERSENAVPSETPAPEPGPLETSATSFAAEQPGPAPQEPPAEWVPEIAPGEALLMAAGQEAQGAASSEAVPVQAEETPEVPSSQEAEPAVETAPEEALSVPEAGADQSQKTVSLEAFSGLTEGAPEPLNEEEAGPGTEEGPFALMPGQGTIPEQAGEPFAGRPENAAPEAFGAEEAGEPAVLPPYENTKDFGIPDIDSLLQLSGGEPERNKEPQASLPEAGVIPESVQAMEDSLEIPAEGAESAGERPSEEGTSMQPKEPEKEVQPLAGAAPEENGQPGPEPEAQASPSPFGPFAVGSGEVSGTEAAPQGGAGGEQAGGPPTDKPFSGGGTPASEQPAAPSLEFETPADAISGGGQGQAEISGAAGRDVPGGIGLFPAAEPAPSAEAPAQPAAGAPGLELGAAPESAEPPSGIPGLELGASPAAPEPAAAGAAGIGTGASAASAERPLPGGTGMELGAVPSASVVPVPETPSEAEDKTAIFKAAPSVTSRAQAGDLSGLAAKTAPEGIPPERVRSLVLMYSPEDKALCATVLAELDSICLKSASKPMFIKRVSVREFEPGMNTEFLLQSVADSGAQGLVCLGSIPQDKIYELENVFSSSGGFFRYYDSSMFSHSSALDLVTDLILR